MAGLDERLHDLVAAAGREVPIPSPDGVRRRGTRRRLVRSAVGGLAVVLLAVGCLLGFRVAQGPDRAVVQPTSSDLPSGVRIVLVSEGMDPGAGFKLVEASGLLSEATEQAKGLNDRWGFPQPDPARKVYQIKMVSPEAVPACLSSVPDEGPARLRPCDARDENQLWAIESGHGITTFRGLGALVGETGDDLVTYLVEPEGGPSSTSPPS